jgi:polyisoprenoid-binding protein YceI
VILLLASLLLATQTFELRDGSLTYAVVHKLHEVHGTTRALEGRAQLQPDGSGRFQVRAKVATFDSGNSNRDEHMREVTHEASHPYASVKGTRAGVTLPLAAPAAVTLHATVELNGVKQAAEIPIQLSQEGARVRAKFSVPLSLEAFQIDRPALLFVKVDDRLVLSGELVFEEAK